MIDLFSRLRRHRPRTTDAGEARTTRRVAPDVLEAERLAAHLPPLSVDTARIAPWGGIGTHGRRQAGHGDSFWQYRPVLPGEPVNRIDWRQSARSERAYVRETEREVAQTHCIWLDHTASMDWRSGRHLPTKGDRAALLALASAAMLLRAGERVRVIGTPNPTSAVSRQKLPAIAAAFAPAGTAGGDPNVGFADVPGEATALLFSDFLDPVALWETRLRALAARPAHAILVQILDPAELTLPWGGRVRFEGLEGEAPLLVPRTDDLRGAYEKAIAAHNSALTDLAARFGARLLRHRTDTHPDVVLQALHQALAGNHTAGEFSRGQNAGPGAQPTATDGAPA